jgi:hypothetical protein
VERHSLRHKDRIRVNPLKGRDKVKEDRVVVKDEGLEWAVNFRSSPTR